MFGLAHSSNKFIGLISRKDEDGCEDEVIKATPAQQEVQTA